MDFILLVERQFQVSLAQLQFGIETISFCGRSPARIDFIKKVKLFISMLERNLDVAELELTDAIQAEISEVIKSHIKTSAPLAEPERKAMSRTVQGQRVIERRDRRWHELVVTLDFEERISLEDLGNRFTKMREQLQKIQLRVSKL